MERWNENDGDNKFITAQDGGFDIPDSDKTPTTGFELPDSERTPSTPTVIETAGAVETPAQKTSKLRMLLGGAALAAIVGTAALTGKGTVSIGSPVEAIKPDPSVEVKKPYENYAIPMLSKDRKAYELNGKYPSNFQLDTLSPENQKVTVIVNVDAEGKYIVKGVFENPVSTIEFKATTLDGKEIAFVSSENLQQYIKNNPEAPKPIIGSSTLSATRERKPTRSHIVSKLSHE